MKTCQRCDQLNDDTAVQCSQCRHGEFVPASPAPPPPLAAPLRSAKPSPEFLITEREGRTTVLKCRSVGEAYLVAEELEAADILVMLPEEAELTREFTAQGYVSLRVSTQSYEAAEELQRIVDRKHWEERANAPLPVPLRLMALGMGLVPFLGWFGYFMYRDIPKNRGYRRQAETLRKYFHLGLALSFGTFIVLSVVLQ